MERKMTAMSNTSQTPSKMGKDGIISFRRQESRNLGSPSKLGDATNGLTADSENKMIKIKTLKEARKLNINSPRFENARNALGIPIDECQMK